MNLIEAIKRVVRFDVPRAPEDDDEHSGLRKDERQAAVLSDKYPLDGEEIGWTSEYRLASLMQYPPH